MFCFGANGLQAQTVKDIDGNVYKTVKIGNQIWMAENLKTTKYNNGIAIPFVIDVDAWKALKTPAFCWYNNDVINKNKYGALYNWYTINTKKLCPLGWHIPSDAEWTTLTTVLGGEDVAGGKLKEAGTLHWKSPNTGATNETGFTALPSGNRHFMGTFDDGGSICYWWSSTLTPVSFAYIRDLYYNYSDLDRDDNGFKESGFSVRCLKDK
jgi:uncharacterized protein (TIGR02145 family)